MGNYKNTVLTYGLTNEDNKALERYTSFLFEDVSDCFTDILARNAVAVIINPEKLSHDELEQLTEVYCWGDVEYNEITNIAANYGKKYVVLDIETTGLSPTADKITEIGAVKIEDGVIVAEFNQLINPGIDIPPRITELTGITNEVIADKPAIEDVLPRFFEFCADSTLVAHNAKFDMGFIKHNAAAQGIECDFEVLDTLSITRRLFPDLQSHKLETVAEHLGIENQAYHRAGNDARTTAQIFLKCRDLSAHSKIVKYFATHFPLFIFTSPVVDLPKAFSHEVCAISDEQGIADKLQLAKNILQCKEDFGDYFNAKIYKEPKRIDNAPIKRVELHARTKMSDQQAGLTPVKELIERAAEWGHKAIAITDWDSVQAFPEAYKTAQKHGIKLIYGLHIRLEDLTEVTLLAKNPVGLKNLYKILSLAHTEHMQTIHGYNIPIIPRDILLDNREGLLIGASYNNSKGYGTILELLQQAQKSGGERFYDYIELGSAGSLIPTWDSEKLDKILAIIGEKHNLPVAAIGTVVYLDPVDEAVWRICIEAEGNKYTPEPLYFHTTEEMLEKYADLGEEKAYEVVVANTNFIADMIEEFPPIPEGFFFPTLNGSEEEMVQICNVRAKEIYGDILPDNVKKRLDHELNSIIDNGYAVIYMIAQRLVKKSNDDGYMVGSRGSVGASLIAYLLGITEVDPIKYNIPFEVFAGLDGDKMPDIDLNFSSDYQAVIQRYVEELFGKNKVFSAGTISTMGERVATGIALRYFENKGIIPAPFEIEALASDLIGIKRTTSQHPGGLIIIPFDKEIYDFTPVQYPFNKKDSGVITTHFKYSSLDNTLLKFDLLGHDSPTMIKKLEDLTGVDVRAIPLDDEKTLDILINTDAVGVPEFSADFVRNMITTANPKTFDDFVKISGLSHGTGVWCDNAENLIKSGVASISEVIALRDEIMVYLMDKGICRETAFDIMERVRKGSGLSDEHEEIVSKSNVPEWYIDSCNKIGYMFPKAHAVAYTITAFRIAWFKAHHPEAFNKAFFNVKKST